MRPVVIALAAATLLPAFPPPAPAQEPTGGAKVYKQAIHSVVWLRSDRRNGYATGSGSLIDRDHEVPCEVLGFIRRSIERVASERRERGKR